MTSDAQHRAIYVIPTRHQPERPPHLGEPLLGEEVLGLFEKLFD